MAVVFNFHPEKCKVTRIGKSRINKKDHTLKDGTHPTLNPREISG
jgi:hypothetical protein